MKHPAGAAKLHFADAFDSDFSLLLGERRSKIFTNMVDDAIEVEENLMPSRKMKGRYDSKPKNREENCIFSSSQTTNARIDMMMKTMERLMETLAVDHRQVPRELAELQNKNQNFRRPPIPQF